MTRSFRIATVLWLALVGRCGADTLYSQPLNNTIDRGAFSWYNGQELADQFTLPSKATIEQVTWYGSFYQMNLPSMVAQYPFVIRKPVTDRSFSISEKVRVKGAD